MAVLWSIPAPMHRKKIDILGTMLLAVLSGQYRYAHISGIRNDTVNPELLGMNKVLSEDSIRRAFHTRIKENAKHGNKTT